MGYENRDVGPGPISLKLDSHGGDRERRDEELAEELHKRLCEATVEILSDERYAEILIFEPDWYGPPAPE